MESGEWRVESGLNRLRFDETGFRISRVRTEKKLLYSYGSARDFSAEGAPVSDLPDISDDASLPAPHALAMLRHLERDAHPRNSANPALPPPSQWEQAEV